MARANYAELGDACATAHAMELIGARWTYPILRELMLGPKRFNVLLTSVFGITPAVLTARIHELTSAGLIELDVDAADSHGYVLTAWALELAPVLRELGRWAQSSPTRSNAGGLTPDAVVQAMITMASNYAPETPLRVHLQLADRRVKKALENHYHVEWTEGGFTIGDPQLASPATVRCDSSTWGRILFDGLDLDDDNVAIGGDAVIVRNLIDAFRRTVATGSQ